MLIIVMYFRMYSWRGPVQNCENHRSKFGIEQWKMWWRSVCLYETIGRELDLFWTRTTYFQAFLARSYW